MTTLVNYAALPKIVKKYAIELNGSIFPTDVFKQMVVDGIGSKLSLARIRENMLIPMHIFYVLLEADSSFYASIQRLLGYAQDELADSLLTMDEDMEIDRAVLRARNVQWYLARKNAKKYGDKLQVEVTTVDLTQALNEAKSRVIDVQTVVPKLPEPSNE